MVALEDRIAGDGPGDPHGSVDCGITPDDQPLHVWSDPTAGLASLVGPGLNEAELWIVATARMGSEVVHWAQGPYPTAAVSFDVKVELPAEMLASSLARTTSGTVSARVVAQTTDGAVLGRWPLPRLVWTLMGSPDGSPVLVQISDLRPPTPEVVDGQTVVSADL